MVLDDNLAQEKTHPDLFTLFVHLAQGENLNNITIDNENEDLRLMLKEQMEIGQHNFLLGFWVLKWKAYQKQYARKRGWNQNENTWATKAQHILWEYVLSLWIICNKMIHGDNKHRSQK